MLPRKKDKTAIVIFGNLASGKSSVGKELSKLLPGYKSISADNFRKDFIDSYGHLEEQKTKTLVEAEILTSGNIIWETTLTGNFSNRVLRKLSFTHKVIKCKIDAPPMLCFNRFVKRPIPSTTVKKDLRENIYEMDERLSQIKSDFAASSAHYAPVVIAHMIKNYLDAL